MNVNHKDITSIKKKGIKFKIKYQLVIFIKDILPKVNITNKLTSFPEERIAHQKSQEEFRSSTLDEYNTERTK